MRILRKTKNDYLENEGWSSRKFIEHAKNIFEILDKEGFKLKFARTVIYIIKGEKKIKVRVHYMGRSNEWITFLDKKNNELMSFHCSCTSKEISDFILSYFNSPLGK
jgi:hypothetical protein